jgi:hypothetical protein
MNSRKSASKYGWMGFCRKAKVSIPYTITNILLCDGCPHFESRMEIKARPLRGSVI